MATEDIKISELSNATELNQSALMVVTQNETSYNASLAQVAGLVSNEIEYSELNTTDKKILGAINEVKSDITPKNITVTAKAGWSISGISATTSGNLATVSFTAKCTTASTTDWYDCAQINIKPKNDVIGLVFDSTKPANTPLIAYLRTTGVLQVVQNSSARVALNDNVKVSVTYEF